MEVDRGGFVPDAWRAHAYEDRPLPIAEGQTISQPSTVAFMLGLLGVEKGDKILDIGAGSGWAACLMGYLAGEEGAVHACEINQKVGHFGKKAVENSGLGNVDYRIGNAADLWKENCYDKIYSGAAFREIPRDLEESLNKSGALVAPTQSNDIRRISKKDGKFEEKVYPGFVFVPFLEE